MAYTYDDFLRSAQKTGTLGKFSPKELDTIQRSPEYGISVAGLMQDEALASSPEQKLLARETINQMRKSYGINGTPGPETRYGGSFGQMTPGVNGSGYAGAANDLMGKIGNYGPYQYQNQDAYQQILDGIANRQPFSYDYESDPSWQAYKKAYTREGQRATADALAQAAAASGGLPSSYAVTAAQQAANYHAGQISDIIPTLEQAAYSRYLDDLNSQLKGLDALSGDRAFDYARWMDEYNMMQNNFNNYQNMDNYYYQKYIDDRNFQFQQAQFDEDKWRYDTEWEKKYGKKPNRGDSEEGSSDSGSTPGTNPAPGAKPGSGTGGILDDVGKQIGDKIKDAADDAWNNPDPKPAAGGYAQVRQDALDFIKAGKTKNEVSEYIHAAAAAGEITPSQAQSILRLL